MQYWPKHIAIMLTMLILANGMVIQTAGAQTTQTVQINADRFVIQESQGQSEFLGNVVVTQPGLTVWADRVIVHYGSGGTTDIRSFEALGRVKIQNDQQTATGNRAVYNPDTRLLTLTGDVVVINQTGTVHASELVVNLATNVTEFSSGDSSGRVTGLFTPGN